MFMDRYGLGCPALWIPACAGMTVRDAGNDRLWLVCLVVAPRHEPPLWIADQVRNDVPG